jgi:hypothetical protein
MSCYKCGTNKKPFSNDMCSVCGGYGLEEHCYTTAEADNKLLFNDDDKVKVIEVNMRMSKLLCDIGLYASIGEADRNGWKDKKIPFGWTDIHVGKRPRTKRLFIWNPKEDNQGDMVK